MGESSSSWTGGWGGWLKEKTSAAVTVLARDLNEFSTTVSKDTKEVVEEKLVKGVVKGIERTGDKMYESLNKLAPTDEQAHTELTFDPRESKVRALQSNAATYAEIGSVIDADDSGYSAWQTGFALAEHRAEAARLLGHSAAVSSHYERLVPDRVPEDEFWKRYFFRLHRLHEEEDRRLALLKRAATSDANEDELTWDDGDDAEPVAHPTDVRGGGGVEAEAESESELEAMIREVEAEAEAKGDRRSLAARPASPSTSAPADAAAAAAARADASASASASSSRSGTGDFPSSDWSAIEDAAPLHAAPDASAAAGSATAPTTNATAASARDSADKAEDWDEWD